MAYCVHCGVKMGEAETKCPLCGTEAIDPSGETPLEESRPFPVRTLEQTLQINRRYAVSLLSVLLLVPSGICLIIDMIGGGITWSIYPAGVLVLIWIAIAVPLLMRKHRLYSTILITGGTLGGYLFLAEQMTGTAGWFLPIVLPALALFLTMICLDVWLIRKKSLRMLRLAVLFFVEIGALSFFVELLCVRSGAEGTRFTWSPYVLIPCFFLALVLYVLSRNGPLSSELKRRFHF